MSQPNLSPPVPSFTAGRTSVPVCFPGSKRARRKTGAAVGSGAAAAFEQRHTTQSAASSGAPLATATPPFSVASYNLLAQSRVVGPKYPYCGPTALKWQVRRQLLLAEVVSFDADVLCLQEVDNYESFWRPELQGKGYDSVYMRRPRAHKDGVAIFYRRDLFQLFGTQELDFNTAGTFLGDVQPSARLQQDNVGLLLALQPWEESPHPSALCVGSVQLVSDPEMRDVQLKQLHMLTKATERFNADFQVPVVLCGSFNFLPHSDHYHLMLEGALPKKPSAPRAPSERPVAKAISRAQIVVTWGELDCGDAPVQGFSIMRRAGGNTVAGFGNEVYVDGDNVRRHTVCGLSSGTTYEFIVAGVSAVGVGEYSAPSKPLPTFKNVALPPPNRFLKHPTENAGAAFAAEDDSNWVRGGGTGLTPRYEDHTINAMVSPSRAHKGNDRGTRRQNLVHSLGVQSTYRYYENMSEPKATLITEQFKGTSDYMFYTTETLRPVVLMTPVSTRDAVALLCFQCFPDNCYACFVTFRRMPSPEARSSIDPRRPETIADEQDVKPLNWDDRERVVEADYDRGIEVEVDNPEYMGPWKPRQMPNPHRFHSWLPNMQIASDHTALRAEFAFRLENLSSQWH